MSEGILKGPILMEGFGRVNLPNFLRSSDVVTDGCLLSGSLSSGEAVLAPLIPFCY